MDIYGLLGYPLGHSFSASYFRQKFEREHLHADYLNFEYPEVCDALSYMLTLHNLKGFNVTIPHKQDIIPRLSSLSAEAEAIGAVNVVKVRQDEEGHIFLDGYNSDLIGFRESIRPLLDQGLHRSALVLGTGGASRAVCYGLHQLGLTTLSVSRSPKPGTITKAADLIMQHGANSVRAIASHCIMSGPADQRVTDSALKEMIFTDSIPYRGTCSKVKELSVSGMLAETIRRVMENESISSQYLI